MITMKIFVAFVVLSLCISNNNLPTTTTVEGNHQLKTGAEQTDEYVPYLRGKRVAILANQTSIIGNTHLVDSLKTLKINIVKVFGPEHGFRGSRSEEHT